MCDLISVIVPVYNSKEYLIRCINSICSQTYSDIEIIVVDDGSIDGSGELCDKLSREDKRIKVIHKENGGSTSARNAGISISNGKYIGFVDSDDWIEQDMFERLYLGCKNNNAEICVGRQFIDRGDISHEEGKRSIYNGIIKKETGEMPHHIIYSDDYKLRGISPNLVDKLFLKELLEKHQCLVNPKTKYAEDDICVYSALLDANTVVFIDKPLYHYCFREESISRKGDISYFEKISLFYEQMREIFIKNESSDLLVNKLNRYMIEFVLRGLNQSFGFGFGSIVPFFQPPYKKLREMECNSIILYGAGDVGKDYYRALNQHGYIIKAWVDKRGDSLREQGYAVYSPETIKSMSYDAIVIATDSDDLIDQIYKYLVDEIKVPNKKIIKEKPIKLITDLNEVYQEGKCV